MAVVSKVGPSFLNGTLFLIIFLNDLFIYLYENSYKGIQIKQLLVIQAINYLFKNNTNYLGGKVIVRRALPKEAGDLDSGPLSKTHLPAV